MDIRYIFFGTAPLAEAVLNALQASGHPPALIVAAPDSPARRGNEMLPPVEKAWALTHAVPFIQPAHLDAAFLDQLALSQWDVFVVASYGKILPTRLLSMPRRGVINLHPSLLPRLRGPSPMRSALLNDEKRVGVSIMMLDEAMDHGPIIAQKEVSIKAWPIPGRDLDVQLTEEGAQLLASVLEPWVAGSIEAQPQNHAQATYCRIFEKKDGLLDLEADARTNLCKICAFDGWPGTYFFADRRGTRVRVAVTGAHIENGRLVIDRVIPEGKREMPYVDFMRST